jgi:hypothetical protein
LSDKAICPSYLHWLGGEISISLRVANICSLNPGLAENPSTLQKDSLGNFWFGNTRKHRILSFVDI